MNTEKFNQLVEFIKSKGYTTETFNDLFGYKITIKEFDNLLGKVELVSETGNTTGGGEYSNKVFYFHNHKLYVMVEGSYYSYDGTHWDDDFIHVEPQQVTRTEYVRVK